MNELPTLSQVLVVRHGAVVDSVNVSVLLYAPVRNASLAPIACLKETVDRVVGHRRVPGRLRERDLQRLRQRERAVGQTARIGVRAASRHRRWRSRSRVVDAM